VLNFHSKPPQQVLVKPQTLETRSLTLCEQFQDSSIILTQSAHLYKDRRVNPFGGYKESGLGRELGKDSLDNYLETKSVWVAL